MTQPFHDPEACLCVCVCVSKEFGPWIPRIQMGPHILEDWTHKMEDTYRPKKVIWVLGMYNIFIYICPQ